MDDEIERFDGTPVTGGYRVVASWGPSRWQLGDGAGAVVYARGGERLWCTVTSPTTGAAVIVELDRAGLRARDPWCVGPVRGHVGLSVDARRAAYLGDRELVVLDLASGDEIFRAPIERARLQAPALSGDGELVSDGTAVWRVADGARVDHSDGVVLSLDARGELALVAHPTRDWRVSELELRRLGANGGAVRAETCYGGLPTHVAWSRDGSRVAFVGRYAVTIWRTREPDAPPVAIERGVIGRIAFVPAGAGERLLAHAHAATDRAALELFELDGRSARTVTTERVGLVAVTPEGDRALVWSHVRLRELELGSGQLDARGDVHRLAPVTRVAWDPSRHAALVMRSDGDLRLWDVERWCTERVVDPDRRLVARTPPLPDGTPRWAYRVEQVAMCFAPDGRRLVFCDSEARVTAIDREGAPIWAKALEPPGGAGPRWRYDAASISDDGRAVRARVTWRRELGREPDGTPIVEDRSVDVMLDARTGAVTSSGEVERPAGAPEGGAPPPRIRLQLGAREGVYVADELVEIDPLLGTPTGVFPSADESTLLVATRGGALLRLDHVRGEPGTLGAAGAAGASPVTLARSPVGRAT